jgi:hypothetical protein
VFVNRVLRRIFGFRREEVTGVWRKVYYSANKIRVIKSRRMKGVEHVARLENTCIQNFSWKASKEESNQKI